MIRHKQKERFVHFSLTLLAMISLITLAAIVYFLFSEGVPILNHVSLKEFLFGSEWYPTEDPASFGIFPLIAGSVAVTLVASLIAIPLGVMTATYLSEIASPRIRSVVKPFIELLAALPSVVIGFIGMMALAPLLQQVFDAPSGLNLINAAILLAFMAVPTICSISEDALQAVPRALKESSLALGATPWETFCRVTFPTAISGIGTAIMLGMSRVIGETMVVLMVAGGASILPESLFDPIRPLPASIAAEMAEAPFRGDHYFALFGCGIVLFAFTFLFNAVAFQFTEKFKYKTQH